MSNSYNEPILALLSYSLSNSVKKLRSPSLSTVSGNTTITSSIDGYSLATLLIRLHPLSLTPLSLQDTSEKLHHLDIDYLHLITD